MLRPSARQSTNLAWGGSETLGLCLGRPVVAIVLGESMELPPLRASNAAQSPGTATRRHPCRRWHLQGSEKIRASAARACCRKVNHQTSLFIVDRLTKRRRVGLVFPKTTKNADNSSDMSNSHPWRRSRHQNSSRPHHRPPAKTPDTEKMPSSIYFAEHVNGGYPHKKQHLHWCLLTSSLAAMGSSWRNCTDNCRGMATHRLTMVVHSDNCRM